MNKRFGIFGEGWPVVLTVVVVGRRSPVARVLAHPMDPTAFYWETAVPREPDTDDPRPFEPVLGRLDVDPRWSDGDWLPARDQRVNRSTLAAAIRDRQKKVIIRP